ncbi:hypothetical protein PRIPAC_91304 [Pristionchus pacificus]|nr:hypothetical protein PRIPAC_91304 [Pristionchus pacificus]
MIPLVPMNICEERLNNANPSFVYNLTSAHICAGAYGHSPINGDSGGPLMLKNGERWTQIGIVSFGYKEYMPQFDLAPAVFTNVREYCEWIEEETEGEAKCS